MGRQLTSSTTLLARISMVTTMIAFAAAGPASGQTLERRLTALLDHPPLDRNQWGVAVLDARGTLVYGRNADRMFVPASNTKLVVTSTATTLLGPGWTVRSSLYGDGPIERGTLRGNLILYGRGDPTWARRCFAVDTLTPGACQRDPFEPLRPLVSALRSQGVERIAGAVIGDGSWFESTVIHPSWENDDLIWAYAAPVTGLGFNENTIVASVVPGAVGQPATISLFPDIGELIVENRVVTVADSAADRVEWRREGMVAVAEGTIWVGERRNRAQLAAIDPNRFTAMALARVLADSGITIAGGVDGTTDPARFRTVLDSRPIAEVESRPLRDWVFPVLNVSQNWVAEMMLKQLGRQLRGNGSWTNGIDVERRFLIDSVGVDSTQFLLHDGSGLSAKNAITPLAFARILAFMQRGPRYSAFVPGLPASGQIGSLRNRFQDTPLSGRVRAKTGSIGQVNSLSGFIGGDRTGDATCRVFSVQANHHGLSGRAMIQAIDSVVVEIGRKTRCARK